MIRLLYRFLNSAGVQAKHKRGGTVRPQRAGTAEV